MNVTDYPTKRGISAPRTVRAYHGCSREVAERIVEGEQFLPSSNTYDWLGEGIYFWEYAPNRAYDWAKALCSKQGGEPAVIGVTLRLGRCLNLLDTEHSDELGDSYSLVNQRYIGAKQPVNRRFTHYLDCEVIDTHSRLFALANQYSFQTVRGCFPEGEPAFPGSKIHRLTHIQIAVRDLSCITGLHLVQFD